MKAGAKKAGRWQWGGPDEEMLESAQVLAEREWESPPRYHNGISESPSFGSICDRARSSDAPASGGR
ncbi:MAG: hypothetical protein ACOC0P_06780 [Planctomycetota bacterium]